MIKNMKILFMPASSCPASAYIFLFMLFMGLRSTAQTCTISTNAVTAIGNTQATAGGVTGQIVSPLGSAIQCNGNTSRGICWSTNPAPTTALTTKKTVAAGDGSFSASMTGLTPGAKYYVRAFAVNKMIATNGSSITTTVYGNELIFNTTGYTHPISTNAISAITSSTAKCGGTFVPGTISGLVAKGIVWSTSPTPTISLSTKTSNGTSVASFSAGLTRLKSSTKYYVRAYATTSSGTVYGNEVSFTTTALVDVDGNSYQTVEIGTQIWMQNNLRTTKYRDGTSIAGSLSNTVWENNTTGAYAFVNNSSSNTSQYGLLYNAHTVTNAKGVCPTGFHVPSDTEWDQLITTLGGTSQALLAMGSFFGGTNSSGFSMTWPGYRSSSGTFGSFNQTVNYWTSTSNPVNPTTHQNSRGYEGSTRSRSTLSTHLKNFGFTIRCLAD